ncbi:MAG: polysaccharide deacetylase family protein [Spirochaetes bacterium]|nr:MAG: polysaccharide deacetylase family protein [Spirochaetota bacterium]
MATMTRLLNVLILTACAAGALVSLSPALDAAQVQVIVYHTFNGNGKSPYDFSVQEMREHIEALEADGFVFVKMSDLLEGNIEGTNNILVTIDDGHKTVLEAYREVLKPRGIKPLLGIYPNIISKKEDAMTWDELKSLVDDGCEIAGHGYYHLFLNEKQYKKDLVEFNNEIFKSRLILEDKLGVRVLTYVYPFGVRSDMAEFALGMGMFRGAFTIDWGITSVPLSANKNIYALPRYMLVRNNYKNIFATLRKRAFIASGAGAKDARGRN